MTPKFAGIDVSSWQGNVNFEAVKKDSIKGLPISFVMVRMSANKSIDARAITNINAAIKAGLNVGLYHYSYAKTAEQAKAEAEIVLKAIKDNSLDGKLTLPIAFDIEEKSVFELGKDKCTAIAKAFMDTIAAANYEPALYTYVAAYNSYFNRSELEKYTLWIAGYIPESSLNTKFGIKNYAMWQFSVAGNSQYDTENIKNISGVSGQCDCDLMYDDLPAKIKAEGKNGFSGASEPETEGYLGFEIGDTVKFLGGSHYGSASSKRAVGGKRSEGSARITAISPNSEHPFHLVGVLPYGSDVFGWVDADLIEKIKVRNPEDFEVGEKIRVLPEAVVYGTLSKFAGWVYYTALFIREIQGDRVVVSTQKTGAVTGAVDKKYIAKL